MAFTREQVAKVYVATFNRAPDAKGLDYWLNDSGFTNIEDVASSFFDSPESNLTYPANTSYEEMVEAAYQNLFARPSDTSGLAYWVGELAAGNFSQSLMLQAMINGAQNTAEFGNDATIMENKTTVGLHFAEAGLTSVTDAKNIMSRVTDNYETVTDATIMIDDLEILSQSDKKYVLSKIVDSISGIVTDYTYNDNEDLISVENSGTWNSLEKYTYDSNGNLISTKRGVEITNYTYDSNNNMLTKEMLNGSGDNKTTETSTYDASGNVLTNIYSSSNIYYSNVVYNTTFSNTYSYDTNNNIVKMIQEDSTNNSNDYYHSSTTYHYYTYDAYGNVLTKKSQSESTSITEGVEDNYSDTYYREYTYDAHGNELLVKHKNSPDGLSFAETNHVITYDSNNNILSDIISYERFDDNSLINGIDATIIYDTNGNVLSHKQLGIYEETTYDANNNILTYLMDFEDYPDNYTTNTYDDNNNVLTSSYDKFIDGTIDSYLTYSWILI